MKDSRIVLFNARANKSDQPVCFSRVKMTFNSTYRFISDENFTLRSSVIQTCNDEMNSLKLRLNNRSIPRTEELYRSEKDWIWKIPAPWYLCQRAATDGIGRNAHSSGVRTSIDPRGWGREGERQIHRLSRVQQRTQRRLNPDGDSVAVCAGYSRVYVYLRKHVRVDIKERVCLQTNRI